MEWKVYLTVVVEAEDEEEALMRAEKLVEGAYGPASLQAEVEEQ